MAKKPDVSGYERFSDVTSRLDEIVGAVRDKGTSLERSLDLFDEAIALGTRAVDLVDKAAFSAEEQEMLAEGPDAAATSGEDAADEDAAGGATAAGEGDVAGESPADDATGAEAGLSESDSTEAGVPAADEASDNSSDSSN